MSEDGPIVLVVEDESSLVDIYTYWLRDDYEIRAARNGEEGLELLDDEVDLVILDRRMPDMTGDEVIDVIQKRGLDCMIVMATAVEPDFDVVAIGVDSYLVKPVGRDELLTTVSRVLDRREYAELEQELFRLVSKRATLTESKNRSVLRENEEYIRLEAQIEELQAQLDEQSDAMDDLEFVAMMDDLERTNSTLE